MNNLIKVLEALKTNTETNETELNKMVPVLRTIINQLRNKGHKILRIFNGEKYYFIYQGYSDEYKQQRKNTGSQAKYSSEDSAKD